MRTDSSREEVRFSLIAQVKSGCRQLMEHHLAALLFLALVALTLSGGGNAFNVGVIGSALCLAGVVQKGTAVDLWVLIPLMVFQAFSMVSAYVSQGTVVVAYVSVLLILPVVYLLMACLSREELDLLRRLCVLWVGAVAAVGILQFLCRALTRGAVRLDGIVGSPNALGIFLVLGWFALTAPQDRDAKLWCHMEPILLAALALTLSMGSFVSMAAGILTSLLLEKRRSTWREVFRRACVILARASVGVGIGMLMYIAARRTDYPWLSLLAALYLLAAAWNWDLFLRFLEERPRAALAAACAGVLVAAAAILSRPNAVDTFAERIQMTVNGLGYMARNPLLGVGPLRWRMLNYYDNDPYFNVWHIHNSLVHIGAETGAVAMGALIAVAVRHFWKKGGEKPGGMAFLIHCLLDTGLFIVSIPLLAVLTVSEPGSGGKQLSSFWTRSFFLVTLGVFVFNITHLPS